PQAPLPRCLAHARRECDAGDLYWFDSCGGREQVAERCGDRICDGDHCEPPLLGPRCNERRPPVSEEGRCEGNLLVYCARGVVRTVDCQRKEQRCSRTPELGAACVPLRPRPCP